MKAFLVAAIMLSASPALAWDGPELWYGRADADNPGGGGILGTGGAHDHGVKCSHCHVERKMTSLAFALEFSPALTVSGGDKSYQPGQRYTITGRMTNANLGNPCMDPYGKNVDNFAASFEDANGGPAGMLEDDRGSSAANCPQTTPMATDAGTTAITKDCAVVFAKGTENKTTYTFYWTAPTSGDVKIFWGAVDGDCMMMSMDDAVVEGTEIVRGPPMAQNAPSPKSPWGLAAFTLALAGFVWIPRRRVPR